LLLARAVVSLGILAYLFLKLDWRQFAELILTADTRYVWPVPLLLLGGVLFASIRWHCVLLALGTAQSIRQCFALYLAGGFYSLILPGVNGGDVARIGFSAAGTRSPVSRIALSVLLERSGGIAILFIISTVAIFLMPTDLSASLGQPFRVIVPTLTVSGMVIGFAALFIGRRLPEAWFGRQYHSKVVSTLGNLLHTTVSLRYSTLLLLLLYTFLFQLADIVSYWFISKSLGLSIPVRFFFAIVPVVYVLTVLPISLGGLGVREGALVYFLGLVGVSRGSAVTLAVLIYFNRAIISGVGWLVHICCSPGIRMDGTSPKPSGRTPSGKQVDRNCGIADHDG